MQTSMRTDETTKIQLIEEITSLAEYCESVGIEILETYQKKGIFLAHRQLILLGAFLNESLHDKDIGKVSMSVHAELFSGQFLRVIGSNLLNVNGFNIK